MAYFTLHHRVSRLCRDIVDTQYMIIQNLLNLKKGELISLYDNVPLIHLRVHVFMTNNMPSGTKKRCKKYQTRKSLNSQNLSFFFLMCT